MRLDATDEVMPPPSVAKIAPHTNATRISHQGSGSKRSAQRMKNRYVSTSGVTKMTPRIRPTSIGKNGSSAMREAGLREYGRGERRGREASTEAGANARGDGRVREPRVDAAILLDVQVRAPRQLEERRRRLLRAHGIDGRGLSHERPACRHNGPRSRSQSRPPGPLPV